MSTFPPAHPQLLPARARQAGWLKQLHRWHWISSALCLLGMLLFAITGITLNHAAQIEARPQVSHSKALLPAPLLASLRSSASKHADGKGMLPPQLVQWCAQALQADVREVVGEWGPDEVYLSLPRPGGDAWLRIGLDGRAEYEVTRRGAISWLNDLHKGRNTGAAWRWFIDLFALACLVFCVTGFLILKYHAAQRHATWPVLGLGVLLPVLLAILFIH